MAQLLMDYVPTKENESAWRELNDAIDRAAKAMEAAAQRHVKSGNPQRTGPGAHGFSSTYDAILESAADYGAALHAAEKFMAAHPAKSGA